MPAAIATRPSVSTTTAAAEGALESRARISAANAGGVAREIFAWGARRARRARLAGKQDRFFFDGRANFSDGKVSGFADNIGLLSGFVLGIGMRFFMSGIGIGFRLLGGTQAFDWLSLNLQLFFVVLGIFLVIVLRFLLGGIFFVVFLFVVIVIEFRAASDCVSGGMLLNFFVLGFDELGSEGSHLILIEVNFAADGRFGLVGFTRRGKNQGSDFFGAFVAYVGAGRGCAARERFFFGRWECVGNAFFGEQPAGKSAREAARTTDAADGRNGGRTRLRNGRHVRGAIWQKVFNVRWLIVQDVLDWRSNGRGLRLAAIFGERFTGQQDRFFGGVVRSGRRTLPGAFAAWLTTARFKAARGTATVTATVSAILISAIVATLGFKITGLEAAVVAALRTA
jgi:hypothetical protein